MAMAGAAWAARGIEAPGTRIGDTRIGRHERSRTGAARVAGARAPGGGASGGHAAQGRAHDRVGGRESGACRATLRTRSWCRGCDRGRGREPWAANPWAANPWAANPWAANPWAANPLGRDGRLAIAADISGRDARREAPSPPRGRADNAVAAIRREDPPANHLPARPGRRAPGSGFRTRVAPTSAVRTTSTTRTSHADPDHEARGRGPPGGRPARHPGPDRGCPDRGAPPPRRPAASRRSPTPARRSSSTC